VLPGSDLEWDDEAFTLKYAEFLERVVGRHTDLEICDAHASRQNDGISE